MKSDHSHLIVKSKGKVVFFLLIVGAGAAAYARARREGTWSWNLFRKTVFALLVLGAGVGALVVRIAAWMGPEHVLLSTMTALAFNAAGAAGIAIWVRGKSVKSSGR